METIKLNDKIWHYKNTSSDIDFILNESLKEHWFSYTNSVNPDGSECESAINGSATGIESHKKIHPYILDIFIKCFLDYIEENNLNLSIDNLDINTEKKVDWLNKKEILIREYRPGSYLSPHTDTGVEIKPALTGLMYFNENFEGGELYFPEYEIDVKPSSGSVLIFPSTILHGVRFLKSGNRYLSSAYIYEEPNNANL